MTSSPSAADLAAATEAAGTSEPTTGNPRTSPSAHSEGDGHSHGHGANWELGFAIAAGITYGLGLLSEYVLHAPEPVAIGFYLATYFFGGFFTVSGAVGSIRRGRFEVDFLMLVAAIGAAAVGKFAEGAVLLFLFSLGHALEEYAMGRAKKSIESLAQLAPSTALVKLDSGEVVERASATLVPGDVVVVRPHARISADGFVVSGVSSVDQSSLTGESIPVDKAPVDPELIKTPAQIGDSGKVFAGTVNGAGLLEIVVSATSSDNTVARLVTMVSEADSTKSRTQRAIDRFQKWYVPSVLAAVAITFAVGALAVNEPFSASFYRAMLVLVAASPCALAIATPAAVLAGVARAAHAGLLVKGGAALENLGVVDAMAFDKTGTLTWGEPRLTDIVVAEGADRAELLGVALAVESASDHPLAGAITRGLTPEVPADQRLQAAEVTAVPGHGVRAVVSGRGVGIGTASLFDEASVAVPAALLAEVDRLQAEGRTTMVVGDDAGYLGVLGVMDTPRAEAVAVMTSLREAGVNELVMISGDNQRAAEAVGRRVGVDSARGGLLPEDKVSTIADLTASGRLTAMIGDGVNDAPAMANATVGVAMGAAGSAVALETADVALLSDDIGRLPFLIRLSRASSAIIRQNFIFSLVIVGILVPASLLGLAMGPVVLVHEGSTLLVVANALRLLRFGRGQEHRGIEHEARPAV